MARQGVVSVLKDGKVALKVVAGCDGDRAKTLADVIRRDGRVLPVRDIYDIARSRGFGCEECLVVIGQDDEVFHQFDGRLPSPYRETFDDPLFNPRWDKGAADFVEVVSL